MKNSRERKGFSEMEGLFSFKNQKNDEVTVNGAGRNMMRSYCTERKKIDFYSNV